MIHARVPLCGGSVRNKPEQSLTGGFGHAFWVLGAIALLALPAIFALVRRSGQSVPVGQPAIGKPEPTLAPAGLTDQP